MSRPGAIKIDDFPDSYEPDAKHDISSFDSSFIEWARREAEPFNVDVLFVGEQSLIKPTLFSSYKMGRFRPGDFDPSKHYSHDILPFKILGLPVDLYAWELRNIDVPLSRLMDLHFDNLVTFRDFAAIILVYDARQRHQFDGMHIWYKKYVLKSMHKYRVKPYLFVLCTNFFDKSRTETELMERGISFAHRIGAEFWVGGEHQIDLLRKFFARLAVLAFVSTVKRYRRVVMYREPRGLYEKVKYGFSKKRAEETNCQDDVRGERSWGTFDDAHIRYAHANDTAPVHQNPVDAELHDEEARQHRWNLFKEKRK